MRTTLIFKTSCARQPVLANVRKERGLVFAIYFTTVLTPCLLTGKSITQPARGPRKVHISQEVKYFLGQANAAYAAGDRTTAIKTFQDIITIEPGIASAWTTLAMCHEEEDDEVRGLQLRIMAAHLEGDVETWIELGLRSR